MANIPTAMMKKNQRCNLLARLRNVKLSETERRLVGEKLLARGLESFTCQVAKNAFQKEVMDIMGLWVLLQPTYSKLLVDSLKKNKKGWLKRRTRRGGWKRRTRSDG